MRGLQKSCRVENILYFCNMKTNLTYKYNWLLNQLKANDGLTLDELKKHYRQSDIYKETLQPLSERTFHYWRNDILETYGIEIYCDRTNHLYTYKIRGNDATISEWLSDTISVQQTISTNLAIKDRILIEPVPNCNFLDDVLRAIKQNLCISFTYTDYWEDAIDVIIKPFFVKMFRQRWHVVGPIYNAKNTRRTQARLTPKEEATIKSYGMDDRFTNLKITNIHFNYPSDFYPEMYYLNNFSTIKFPLEHLKVEKIRILAWENQNFYLRSVPLHHSQKEVYTSKVDAYSIFEYTLQPTLDFERELRAYGDYIEVLSPKWFREQMRENASNIVKAYKGYDRASLKQPLPSEFEPEK